MVEQTHERKPSAAKAAIAQQKPRDASGKFLSGAELENYRAQQQQAQFEAERAKVSNLLGRSSQPQTMQPMQQMQVPQSNFQAILAANKPGSDQDVNRWNTLLGRDTTSKGRKKYRW